MYIKDIIQGLLIGALVYLAFVFVTLEPNIFSWSPERRFTLLIINLFLVLIGEAFDKLKC